MRARLLIPILLLVGGCFTPSVPVPPPGPESLAFASTGTGSWNFTATPNPNWADSWVVLMNRGCGCGIVTRTEPDGSVVPTPFDGNEGDELDISYERDSDHQRAGLCIILHAGPGSSANLCP
jgi:hypothetical protein